jgi:hypothetical protein
MNVKEFIQAIKKNPRMFVEEIRMDYIEHVIYGFISCNLLNKRGDHIDLQFHNYFWNWMVTWIKKNIDRKYKEKYYSWNKTLKDVTNNETETIELFFKLCDLFFEEYDNEELSMENNTSD